jgi:hypothetical protein
MRVCSHRVSGGLFRSTPHTFDCLGKSFLEPSKIERDLEYDHHQGSIEAAFPAPISFVKLEDRLSRLPGALVAEMRMQLPVPPHDPAEAAGPLSSREPREETSSPKVSTLWPVLEFLQLADAVRSLFHHTFGK